MSSEPAVLPAAFALARPDVRSLPLYAPDVADCAIDLSDNTNLWGLSPAARRADRKSVV